MNWMTKQLTMYYCKKIANLTIGNDATFYNKKDNSYTVVFSGLSNIYEKKNFWQNVNVQILVQDKNNTVSGVAFFPKRTNSFMKIGKYYDGYYAIENGEIKTTIASKKAIKLYKKILWWFPFTVNLNAKEEIV